MTKQQQELVEAIWVLKALYGHAGGFVVHTRTGSWTCRIVG